MTDGPKYLDRHGNPNVVEYDLKIRVFMDDVITIAQLTGAGGVVVSSGYAKRRVGDKRNPTLGQQLAVARALKGYAAKFDDYAHQLLHPPVEPDAELVKAMRRANRSEAVKRKNERRREARVRHYREHGRNGLSGEEPTDEEIRDALGRAFGDWS